MQQSGRARLLELYNARVESVERFRSLHHEYAASYTFRQAQTDAKNPHAVGTGGTPFMPYLKKHRDETEQHREGIANSILRDTVTFGGRRSLTFVRRLFLLFAFLCWSSQAAEDVLWRDPGPVEKLDFASGPGGPEMVPKPPFRFVKEDLTGTQPKVEVIDVRGHKWVAKFGMKVHSEPLAGRIAWACGYFVEPIHYVARGQMTGAKHLKRAAKYIREDGTFEGARFQIRDPHYQFSKTYNWSWHNNPFIGTRQLNGLKILLMLTSNWDNKDATMQDAGPNTGIFVAKRGGHTQYIYSFYDWGGTMGRWGLWPLFRVWDCKAYAEQTKSFIKGVDGGEIRFGYFGRDVNDLRRGVRPTDAAWLMQYLGRITDAQLRTGLVASGATEEEVSCFLPAIRDRINQVRNVARRE